MTATATLSTPELSAPLDGLARPRAIIGDAAKTLRMPKRLRLSEWADAKFYLSAESSAEPGKWRTIPYQRGVMDAITDPTVERVVVMKSARVGWTKILDAAVGLYMEQDPCPILVVQPTVEDAEGYSKEEIDPMLRDCPALRGIVRDSGRRDGKNTILHKKFAGGVLSMVGANSGRGFRRVSRKIIALDEADAYPPSAGNDGDPIALAIKRSEYYWDRKVLIGSTPLIAGASRIAEEFEKGDQRRFHVPCPHCGHMDFLTFREQTAGPDAASPRGHYMKFDTESPEAAKASACFVCRSCGCFIEHQHKRWMVERGEWRADKPFRGIASFALWAAYSYSPNATWGHIAQEFLEAKAAGVEQLQTFVNTVLGETWVEKGEAPEWERLYQRRERFEIRRVPRGAIAVTCGIDVQMDRLVYEIIAWADDFQTWGLEADVIMGDTAKEETWAKATELIGRQFLGTDGLQYPIHMTAVDSGYNTQAVYNWARQHPAQVIACKGSAAARTMLSQPTAVDVTWNGRRITNGCKVWIVGANIVKGEFYGWLRQDPPTKESGKPYPRGFCHFPESDLYDEEYFKQITAEQILRTVNRRTRRTTIEWTVLPGRENHYLDCRGLNRVAAYHAGLDQLAADRAAAALQQPEAPAAPPAPPPAEGVAPAAPDPTEPVVTPGNSWFHGGRRRS